MNSRSSQTSDDAQPVLRRARNADGKAVRDLVFSILEEYGLPTDPDGIDADLWDIEANYDAVGGVFFVVQAADGRIIGSVAIAPMPDGGCELRKMYLARSHRGRRLGKLLLETAITQARRMNAARITLETAAVLKEAIGLYRSYGFKPFDAPHLCFRCDQAYALDLVRRQTGP